MASTTLPNNEIEIELSDIVIEAIPPSPEESAQNSNSTSSTELDVIRKAFSNTVTVDGEPLKRTPSPKHPSSKSVPSQTFIFTKSLNSKEKSKHGKTTTKTEPKLRNNLLLTVGLLDLASACDFPANIWNSYPVPTHASVLMVFGGLIAITIALCALKDFKLAWPNYVLLRSERQYLNSLLHRPRNRRLRENHRDKMQTKLITTYLEVNTREIGNEIARLGMDGIMGIGVFLVGVGTLMALGGSHHHVFHVSNLLSGYIGNAPIALYGLLNSAWSIYLFLKTYHHEKAGRNLLQRYEQWIQSQSEFTQLRSHSPILETEVRSVRRKLSQRFKLVRLYSALYGIAGFFTGVGSLISATRWWGYVISFPWIWTSLGCNWLVRRRIGYDRRSIQALHLQFAHEDEVTAELVREIVEISKCLGDGDEGGERYVRLGMGKYDGNTDEEKTEVSQGDPERSRNIPGIISHDKSPEEIWQFILKYDLFDSLCTLLIHPTNSSLLNDLTTSNFIITETSIIPKSKFPFVHKGIKHLVTNYEITTYTLSSLNLCNGIGDARLVEVMRNVVGEFGEGRLRMRRRFLVEVLGCWGGTQGVGEG